LLSTPLIPPKNRWAFHSCGLKMENCEKAAPNTENTVYYFYVFDAYRFTSTLCRLSPCWILSSPIQWIVSRKFTVCLYISCTEDL
jgi:hypothetical protein